MKEKEFRKIWEEVVSDKYLDSNHSNATFKDSHEFSLNNSLEVNLDSIPLVVEEESISYIDSQEEYEEIVTSTKESPNNKINSTLSGETITPSEEHLHNDKGTLSGETVTPSEEHSLHEEGSLSGGSLSGEIANSVDTLSGGTVDNFLKGENSSSNNPTNNFSQKTNTLENSKDNYEIFDEINRGGMGTISSGRQNSLKRNIAVKQILPQNKSINSHRQKFISEALVTAYLDHPNIIPVYELTQNKNKNIILAMKLIDGVSWKTLLKNESKTFSDHMKILLSVCDAMAYAHNKGVIHNDLKPDNIMVGKFGEVFVMDWGIAVDISENTKLKRTLHKSEVKRPMGTPSYIPIELAEGNGANIGPWTDVYLLGAILCEIITGKPPHHQETVWLSLISCREGHMPEFDEEVSEEMQEICYVALSRKKEKRYQSVQKFQQAIERYLQHRESFAIEEKARNILEKCKISVEKVVESKTKVQETQRNRLYSGFAQSVAFFEQSLMLWEKNYPAHRGELQARSLYAEFALLNGDVGLAEAQAELLKISNHSEASDILEKVEKTKKEKIQHQKRYEQLRHARLATIIFIIAGLSIFTFSLYNQKKLSDAQTQEAGMQREAAYYARNVSTNREQEANRAKKQTELYAHQLEKQKQKIIKEAEQAKTTLAEIALQKASESYDNAQWKNCGIYSGIGMSLIKNFANKKVDHLRQQNESFIRLALQKENLIWKTDPGYGNKINAFLYIPKEAILITAANDKDIRAWNIKTGKQVFSFHGHTDSVYQICYDKKRNLLISASADKTIRVWDIKTKKQIASIYCDTFSVQCMIFENDNVVVGTKKGRIVIISDKKGFFQIERHIELSLKKPIRSLYFTDKKHILATSERIFFIDITTGIIVAKLKQHPVQSVAYQKKDRILVIADNSKILILHDGIVLKKLPFQMTKSLSFLDTNLLASCSKKGNVTIWNLVTGKSKILLQQKKILAMAYAPKKKILFTNSNSINAWSITTGKKISHLSTHSAPITAVTFNHTGDKIASASEDNSVRIWNANSGLQTQELLGHTDKITAVAFHPNKNILASSSYDKSIRLWNLSTKKHSIFSGHNDDITTIVVHPNSKFIASGSKDNNVCVWKVPSGEQEAILSLHEASITSLAYDRKGILLACGAKDGSISIWKNNKKLLLLSGHKGAINKLLFHPNKNILASASNDKTISLWNLQSGKKITTFARHSLPVTSLLFSNNLLISGGRDKRICIWNLQTRKLERSYYAHKGWITHLEHDYDKHFFISASSDGNVIRWNYTNEQHRRFAHNSDVSSIAFNDSKPIFASAAGSEISIWNNNSRTFRLKGHSSWVKDLSFRKNSNEIASCSSDNTICVWNSKTGRKIIQLDEHNTDVNSIFYTPNGNYLISTSKKNIIIWDAGNKKNLSKITLGHTEKINDIAFSPDKKTLVSVSDDSYAKIWNIKEHRVLTILRGHNSGINAVDYSPKGKYLATASNDKTIRIWDLERNKAIWVLFGHTDEVTEVVYNNSGNAVATASKDGTVRIWNIATGKATLILKKMHGVYSLKYGKNSRILTIASNNKNIELWDIASKKKIEILTGHTSAVRSIAYNPKGDKLISGSNNKILRLWNIPQQPKSSMYRGHYNRSIFSVSHHPKEKKFATVGEDNYVRVWEINKSKSVDAKKHKNIFHSIMYNHDGTEIATGNKKITIWRSSPFIEKYSFVAHNKKINQLAYNKDSSILASSSDDTTIGLWRKIKGKYKRLGKLNRHVAPVISISFHPIKAILASASEDNTIRIWDLKTKEQIKVLSRHKATVNHVTFNADGSRLATASNDKTIRIWNTENWKEIHVLRGHKESVLSLKFQDNSLMSVSGSKVIIWDTTTAKLISQFSHTNATITRVAYNSYDKNIITISSDKVIRSWNFADSIHLNLITENMPKWFQSLIRPYQKRISKKRSTFDLRSDIPGYLLKFAISKFPRITTENLFDAHGTDTFAIIDKIPTILFEFIHKK